MNEEILEVKVTDLPRFPRCSNCHRLIKSSRAFRFEGKLYGTKCFDIIRGVVKEKPCHNFTGVQTFDFE